MMRIKSTTFIQGAITAIVAVMVMGFVAFPASAEIKSPELINTVDPESADIQNVWINPIDTTNRSTVYRIGNGTLRIGYNNGKQYGWGKLYDGGYDSIYFL